jgi:hypothetical protein
MRYINTSRQMRQKSAWLKVLSTATLPSWYLVELDICRTDWTLSDICEMKLRTWSELQILLVPLYVYTLLSLQSYRTPRSSTAIGSLAEVFTSALSYASISTFFALYKYFSKDKIANYVTFSNGAKPREAKKLE